MVHLDAVMRTSCRPRHTPMAPKVRCPFRKTMRTKTQPNPVTHPSHIRWCKPIPIDFFGIQIRIGMDPAQVE